MIAAHLTQRDGTHCLLLVLEPGNVEKLKLGQPLIKHLRDFIPDAETDFEICIAFTPDPVFVAQQWRKDGDLAKALQDSLDRPEIYLRDPEKVVKETLPKQNRETA